MEKYMRRKCGRGGAAGDGKAAPAVVLGARTRSRAAVAVPEQATPAKRRKQAAEEALPGGADGGDASGGCYLHLRSRKLFMPATSAVAVAVGEASAARLADSAAASGEAVAVGISRCCSSTASSTVDVAARERSGGEAEARENVDVESSVSDSSERSGRESLGRETTPSSRPPIDCSDLESSQAQATDEQKKCKRRRSPAATTTTTAAFHLQSRLRMPAEEEIDEFFAAAEKAQAQRFAAKYNFDVALGLPLNAGRFEWTPVATV